MVIAKSSICFPYLMFSPFRGAKIEKRDKDNFTPLLLAACYGHADTIKRLIKRGADLKAVDKDDKNAIYWTAEEDHLEALSVSNT